MSELPGARAQETETMETGGTMSFHESLRVVGTALILFSLIGLLLFIPA